MQCMELMERKKQIENNQPYTNTKQIEDYEED